jgi:CubicO group peptidase (beta-lactamase class C family)
MEQRYEFIRAILSRPPEAQPGSKMIYSNQGYAVAGAMLEKVSGKPWEDLMTQRLFQPLHMESAGFGPPGTPGAVDQPWGHAIENGAARPSQGDNPPAIAPAARAHCSLPDLGACRNTDFRRTDNDSQHLEFEPFSISRPPFIRRSWCFCLCLRFAELPRAWSPPTAE